MKHLGRWIGVVAVLAVPTVAIVFLYQRSGGKNPGVLVDWPARAEESAAVPEPLPSGPPEAGLTFQSSSDPSRRDVRGFRHLALYVPDGAAPSQFLSAEPFVATFQGRLRVATRDRYTFTFVGTGTFEFTLDGKPVAMDEALRLRKGEHPFTAVYRSPPQGPAVLRLYWQSRDFGREPVPSRALAHESSPSLVRFAQLRAGYHLVRQGRCGRCHQREDLGPTAPSLAGIGGRLRREWMGAWIEDPRALRPDATMPRVLHGEAAPAEARDIAAYLATLGDTPATLSFSADEAEAGGLRFSDSGCIACHTLPGAGPEVERLDRVPLAGVRRKWHPAALVAFLRQPSRHYPGIGMPDFGLDEAGARALAAFLFARSPDPGSTVDPGSADPVRGEALVAARGCAACHGVAVANRLRAEPEAVTKGGRITCRGVDYPFTPTEREALRAYLVHRPTGEPTEVEAVEHGMAAWRCVHCHRWHSDTTVLGRAESEIRAVVPIEPGEGLTQGPPDLSFAGSKLRTEWLVRWLAGEVVTPPRPWLHQTMPTFALDPRRVATGLAFAEGYGLSGTGAPGWQDGSALPEKVSAAVEEWVPVGRKLVERDGGLGCIQCHGIGPRPAEEVFEAPGINLELTPLRLRREYYHLWVRDPLRIDPTTKMTRFAGPDGRTGLVDVFEGRGRDQFEAIWRYLESLKK